jgi:hypothetical protein
MSPPELILLTKTSVLRPPVAVFIASFNVWIGVGEPMPYVSFGQYTRSTLQGTTKCYGAVVFNSSPKEGPDGIWNYTLKADATFGTNIYVQKTNNDAEIYQLPLQRAVDMAITAVNSTGTSTPLPTQVDEYRMSSRSIE